MAVRRAPVGAVVVAGLLALVPGAVPIAAGAPAPSYSPLPVLISARGETVPAGSGSYCVNGVSELGSDTSMSECGDASEATRPPRERLAVGPGDRVLLRFQGNPRIEDDVRAVHVSVVRVGAEGPITLATVKPRRVAGTPNRWQFRMPARLRGANALDVRARFRGPQGDGSSDYLAGLRVLPPR